MTLIFLMTDMLYYSQYTKFLKEIQVSFFLVGVLMRESKTKKDLGVPLHAQEQNHHLARLVLHYQYNICKSGRPVGELLC